MVSPSGLKKPPALKRGDTIAIAATASCFNPEAFRQGVGRIQSWGFEVRYRDDIFSKKRYLAGEDARRLEEIKEYLLDDSVRAIFLARGGYGSMRLLPSLAALPTDLPPKILLGYSDFTSILSFVRQHWGWVAFQGPVVAKDIGGNLRADGEASLLRALTDPAPLGPLSCPALLPLHAGRASGPLVGGCLSLIVCSLGTSFQIQAQDSILYLEDVGEKLYSLDRMLTHLRLAGIFDQAKGIVFGPLKDAHDKPEVIADLLKDLTADLKLPILSGFPCGHMEDSWTIPLGVKVTLDADHPALIFEESALAPR